MHFVSKSFIFLIITTLSFSLGNPCLANIYAAPDDVALATDEESEKDLPTLVNFLTKDFQDDSDKIRAISVWIAYHVDFDDYKQQYFEMDSSHENLSEKTPSSGDIFVTRKGISSDYAYLLKQMAELAGIKAAVIKGYYKGYRGSNHKIASKTASNYDKNRALWYWNAVAIDGTWKLIDTAIATTMVNKNDFFSSNSSYYNDIQKRIDNNETLTAKIRNRAKRDKILQPNDRWFFVTPEKMIEKHLPEDDEWQLKSTITDKDTFFNN